MANTVEITVKGTDQSRGAFKSVADDTKRAGDNARHMGTGLKLAAVAAGGLVAGGLVKFLKDSVAEARESQKVNAQTAAVLKSTGGAAHVTADEIGRLATKISNKTGIDDEQIQSSENMLLTFTNVRNEVGKGNDIFNQATQTVTDMSVALGVDGKNAAIMLGKALNDPIRGVTALQRVGVTFTEEQKKEIKTLTEHGDRLKAQKIILNELGKEFGGSAAAQATAGEKMRTIWKNFEEDIGTKLLPVLDKMEQWFAEKVVPVLEDKVIPAISDAAKWITGTLVPAIRDQLGPPVAAFAGFFKDKIIPALQSLGDWIAGHKQLVADMAVAVATFIGAFKAYKLIEETTLAIKGLTLAMMTNPYLAAAAAILAVGAAFVVAYQHSREFRDNVGDAISDVKIWALELARVIMDDLVGTVVKGFSMILDGLVRAFGWVPIIGPKLKAAKREVDSWADSVRKQVSGIKADIKTEQVKMKIRDIRREIDNIRQNKVPSMQVGTAVAANRIQYLQYLIDHLQNKAITITTNFTETHNIFTVQNAVSNRGPAGVTAQATGGPWRAASGGGRGGYGYINEAGPELVKLPNGSMIYPAGQSRGMWDNATKGKNKIVIEINSGGSRLDDMLVEILRKAIRVRGGDVQLVLGR